jgi:hypothetical protein
MFDRQFCISLGLQIIAFPVVEGRAKDTFPVEPRFVHLPNYQAKEQSK